MLDGLYEVFRMGGAVMPFLVGLTALLWYGIGYRMLALRAGPSVADALAGASHGVVGRAAVAAKAELAKGTHGLRDRIELALHEARKDLRAFASAVRIAVVLAPLLGLLGTVIGMIETFDSLAAMVMFTRGGGIAAGISEALFTTQMGLVVAVPGLLAGRMLDRRQERIEDALDELVDAVCAGPAREAA